MKKFFAVAGVTAFTGLVFTVSAAGCSSSSSTTTTDDAGSSSGNVDSGKPKPTDGGSSSGDTDAATTCPSSDPVMASDLPWKSPTPPKANICPTDTATQADAYFKANPNATNADFENWVKTTLGANCHDCIFADANGATWPPAPLSNGSLVTLNIGYCYAIQSGKEDCGKAIQNEFDCEFVACADCADQTTLDNCRKKVQSTVCKSYGANIATACMGVPATIDNECGGFFDSVRVACITTVPPDGGDGG